MKRLSARRVSADVESTVNPMDGLGNLADAMLVLAVGIMLALILNWKVDIGNFGVASAEAEAETRTETHTAQSIPLEGGDLSDASDQPLDRDQLDRVGALYYDEETGSYYAILDEE